MPHTIVFDTNYLRSFASREYLAGRLPEKIGEQINGAFRQGGLVALPETVLIETNAWLAQELDKERRAKQQALDMLTGAGFIVTPPTLPERNAPDIIVVMQAQNSGVALLAPIVEDYREAERRTIFSARTSSKEA